ncbi:MAG: YhfC family intramembrane metalloprotease [Chloroflexi bacterium]|nr:MAG: YhfC family intramembrane metalloprotease [Chloroflexota bacterium]
MIYFLLTVNFSLMIVLPFLFGWLIARKRGAGWRLFGIGAVTFVLSQVGHIPFNWLVLNRLQLISTDTAVTQNLIILAIFLGLSAGLFEEVARYLTFRFWATDARSWGTGLMVGAGHGGVESLLLGGLGALNVINLIILRSNEQLINTLPPEQLEIVQAQITAVFNTPYSQLLLGAVERLFAITVHLSLSLLVMQVFIRRQTRWLLFAILWHTLLNAVSVIFASRTTPYITELVIGIFALVSLGIIWALKAPEPAPIPIEPVPDLPPIKPATEDLTPEKLDESKFS